MLLYHRTSIARARKIIKDGLLDERWDFGLKDVRTGEEVEHEGVWLSGRPLTKLEGPSGDAVLEITVSLDEEALHPYELEGLLEDTRLWVAPAEMVNPRAEIRILEVDPSTSWWYEAQQRPE